MGSDQPCTPSDDEVRESFVIGQTRDGYGAEEVRKAKAEALREAKGRVYASSWWADGSDNYADRVRGFLGTLAAEYETGDSDEHR